MSAAQIKEKEIEAALIDKLAELKYTYRSEIRSREALDKNFREKFEELNKVKLTDAEFTRLLDQIITPGCLYLRTDAAKYQYNRTR